MNPVDFLPGARQDFDASFDWYSARSAQAAVRFTGAINDTLTRIATQPDQFAAIDKRHREGLVRRFPFRIIYRVESDGVLIVAVAHAKRRPNYWKRRR
jgi:plasmid stabilization system protein ParE